MECVWSDQYEPDVPVFDKFRSEPRQVECVFSDRYETVKSRIVPLDATHPIFHSFFSLDTLAFHHPYEGVESEFWGIHEDNDPDKRLMAIINYNNDIGELWEFSATGWFPVPLTNEAYKLGINYIVYAMTH